MSIQTPVMKKPCGCQGDCDCNKDICAPCGNSSFLRPRFFAGQLLTEEDLQALANYTVEKQRLQNRYLFGEGVVCGLAVKLHPCEDQTRKVIVQPGYAINCCGDDIVVQCEEELDILKMVNDLRQRLLGRDCRDPCAEKKRPGQAESGNNGDAKLNEDEVHTYCLYIKYCEQPTDRVAPYAFDEPCSENRCEYSRIQESYSFELRCPPTEEKPDAGLFNALSDCRGKIRNYGKIAARSMHALATLEAGARVTVKAQSLKSQLLPATFDPVAELRRANVQLKNAQEQGEEKLDLADAVNELLAVAFRALYVESDAAVPARQIVDLVRPLPRMLSDLLPKLREEKRIQEDVANLLIERSTQLEEILKTNRGERATNFDGRARITGDLLTKKMVHEALRELDGFKDDLLNLSASGAVSLEPQLRQLLARVSLQRFVDNNAVDREELLPVREQPSPIRQQAEIVGRAVAEVNKQCLCDAFLPPCPPCDDPAVLLACVKVKECKVVDVCNLQRKTVISSPALMYWFSGFGPLLDLLRHACCPTRKQESVAKATLNTTKLQLSASWRGTSKEIESLGPASQSADVWNKLMEVEISEEERGRFTVVSPPPSVLKIDKALVPAEQSLTLALSNIVGRPGTDLKPVTEIVRSLNRDAAPKSSPMDLLFRSLTTSSASGIAAVADESVLKSVMREPVTPEQMMTHVENLIDRRVAAAVAAHLAKMPEAEATSGGATPAKKVAQKKAAREKATPEAITTMKSAKVNTAAKKAAKKNTAKKKTR